MDPLSSIEEPWVGGTPAPGLAAEVTARGTCSICGHVHRRSGLACLAPVSARPTPHAHMCPVCERVWWCSFELLRRRGRESVPAVPASREHLTMRRLLAALLAWWGKIHADGLRTRPRSERPGVRPQSRPGAGSARESDQAERGQDG